MQATLTPAAAGPTPAASTQRYARTIEASKRVRWDIDRDVIRDRRFDFDRKFLPDGLSKVDQLAFLPSAEARFLSQVQGRTYANMFALVERFIGAKALEVSRRHWLGDQVALEALVRLSDEELKHQELFRRLERMIGEGMPAGYVFKPQANEVAGVVLGKSTWAVLGLTLDIELFSQAHYRSSIDPDPHLSELWKDVFLFHWKEESQHAIVDELEWRSEDARLDPAQRDAAVDELIELVGAVDGICQAQAAADTEYFLHCSAAAYTPTEQTAIGDLLLKAYRWQYIVTGAQEPRFADTLVELVTPAQLERIGTALAPILAHAAS